MPYIQVPEHLADVACRCIRPLVLYMDDAPGGRTIHGRTCARCGGALTPDDLAHIDADLQQEQMGHAWRISPC